MAVLGLRFVRGLSLAAASGGHSSSRCAGLSLSRSLLLRSTGSRRAGSVAVAHRPSALRHVGSSQTRARTRVPCIGRQIFNHCATREAQGPFWASHSQPWRDRRGRWSVRRQRDVPLLLGGFWCPPRPRPLNLYFLINPNCRVTNCPS